jgi:hypothetical protein
MTFNFLKFTAFSATLLSSAASFSSEDNFKNFEPVVDYNTKLGNNRNIYSMDFMIPLSQRADALTFADLRGVVTDQNTTEGNFGVGYRKIHDKKIIGVYGFYDTRRSFTGFNYEQITFGGEILTKNWDFRANMYHPLSRGNLITDTGLKIRVAADGRLIADSGQTFEKSLKGFDFEVGRRIPLGEKRDLWANVAYYRFFSGNNTNIKGARLRAHTNLTPWLRLGYETLYDEARGHNHYADIRVRIPLGKSKKLIKHKGLRARMMEPIERDIDIVVADVPGLISSAYNPGAGANESRIYFVDNTAGGGGNGSPGSPYNTLAAGISAAGNNDFIYVYEGDGTSTGYTGNFVLRDTGQKLYGEGVDFYIDGDTVTFPGFPAEDVNGFVVIPAGGFPILTSNSGDTITIRNNSGIEVAGVRIDNAADEAIYIRDNNADNAIIRDVIINSPGNEGIFSNSGDNLIISNVQINNAGQDAIYLNNSADTLIRNTTITSPGRYGVRYRNADNNVAQLVTVNNSGNHAFSVENGSGSIELDQVTVNTTTAGDGINLSSDSEDNFAITNSNITGAFRHGIYNNGADNGTITDTNITNTGADGIHLTGTNTGHTINDILVTNAGDDGLYAYYIDGTNVNTLEVNGSGGYGLHYDYTWDTTLANITVTGSGTDGIRMTDSRRNPITTATITNAGAHGYNLVSGGNATQGSSQSTLTNATITNATRNGVNIDGDAQDTFILNNVDVTGSGESGIYVDGADSGTINGSDITGSADSGIYLTNGATANTIENLTVNTSTGNGIELLAGSNSNTIDNVNITNTTGTGLFNYDSDNNQFTDLSITGSGSHGMFGLFSNNASTYNMNFSGTKTFNNNGGYGFVMLTNGTTQSHITLDTATANGNALSGFSFQYSDTARTTGAGLDLSNIMAGTNTGNGIEILSGTNADIRVYDIATANTSGNTNHGVNITGINNSQIGSTTGTISNLTSSSNGNEGLFVNAQNSSTVNMDLTTATLNNNGDNGVIIQSETTSNMTIDLTSVDITNSQGQDGLFMQANNSSTMTATLNQVNSTGNADDGMDIRSNQSGDMTWTLTGSSEVSGNADSGIELQAYDTSDFTGQFQNLTATGNTNWGAYVNDDSTGTVTMDLGGGALSTTGNNRIFSNTNNDIFVDVDGGTLRAENNWWGQAGGPLGADVLLNSGSLDSAPALGVNPGP